MNLKALFYPQVIFIETCIKNYVLEIILEHGKTDSFEMIYESLLTNYKSYAVGSTNYKKELNKRLNLRNKFYGTLSRDYSSNKQVVQYFYHQDRPVPIWSIFEVIDLGAFGTFVSCLNQNIKHDISKSLGLNQGFDSDGKMTETIIFLVKDLRNSIAHNDVIFDTRFKSSSPKNSLKLALTNDTGINNITFDTIVDYLILLIFIQKQVCVSKAELSKIVSTFENSINHLVPFSASLQLWFFILKSLVWIGRIVLPNSLILLSVCFYQLITICPKQCGKSNSSLSPLR
ncbi:Abi-like protein [Anaerovirgula multivorans]|uniref:Abi-like protein n=2 Tax=Anaerovirgula multivorans TaxID=312168 RepID=A0A239KPH8_9FIRM|nr:Abi-like protein [Anaerovirgula multivorans]